MNIKNSFIDADLFPFQSFKVLRHVASSLSPISSSLSSPPPQPMTSITFFTDSILTSSSVDMNAVHKANTTLAELLLIDISLPAPVRNYIHCLTRVNDRLYARNSILTQRIEAATIVLSERKERQNGKRKSIQGKNVMTAEEVHSVKHAESVTQERKKEDALRQPIKTRRYG